MHKCAAHSTDITRRTTSWALPPPPPPGSLRETSTPRPLQDRLNALRLKTDTLMQPRQADSEQGQAQCTGCPGVMPAAFLPSACGRDQRRSRSHRKRRRFPVAVVTLHNSIRLPLSEQTGFLLETLFSSPFAPCRHSASCTKQHERLQLVPDTPGHDAGACCPLQPQPGGRGAPHVGGRGQKGCPGLRPKDSWGQRSAGVAGRRCSSLAQQSPTLLAPGTGFGEDNFSMNGVGRGWFPDDFSVLYLLCTLLLLHQLHLQSSGIGPQRLETPA